MLTRKAIVDRAIAFKNPDRVPVWVDGSNIGLSDVLTFELSLSRQGDPRFSEWGFRRVRSREGSWLIPPEGTLTEWPKVDAFQIPAHDFDRRFARIPDAARVCGDRYRLASFGLSGFAVYSALRGTALCYDDCLRDFDRAQEFFEKIIEFETEMFDTLSRKGFHGIEFCDDWGPRKTSRLTLSLWRVLFKKYYEEEFKRAKEAGLHVWFSVSEEGAEFFGDLKEIGADVVRVENPEHMEVSPLGRRYRNRLCFAARVDELVDPESEMGTFEAIRSLRECLGVLTGGFIATVADNVPQERIKTIREMVSLLRGV
ncbi:MAG: hypothetical protein IJM30_07970 [Thermoguttaceae bacterium]|nr:hypothetical protein [Thermoguttaceae bacterium]